MRTIHSRVCVGCGDLFKTTVYNKKYCDFICRIEAVLGLDSNQRFRHRLKARYGITPGEFASMLDDTEGCCPICSRECHAGGDRTDRNSFVVDHDHATGHVRGLICHACNLGLGAFRDDPNALRKAADYLLRHACREFEFPETDQEWIKFREKLSQIEPLLKYNGVG